MLKELKNAIQFHKDMAKQTRKVGLRFVPHEHEQNARRLTIHLMLRD